MESRGLAQFPVIILAAGKSERAGVPKGLIRTNGRYWLQVQLDNIPDSVVSRRLTILGNWKQEYLAAFPSLDHGVNSDPDLGPFSTLVAGIRELGKVDGAFVLPIDVPSPSKKVWEELARKLNDSVLACTPECHGKGGHPVLLSGALLARFLALDLSADNARLDQQLRLLGPAERVRVKVEDPRILENRNHAEDWADPVEVIGTYGALLSGVEIGLGSILHSFKIPLAGHFLSLNEAFLLSRALDRGRSLRQGRTLPFSVANIAALLKSLSPAGQKLEPMLAISAQGLLFTIGTILFGANLAGAVLGSILLGLWGFLQPVAIYYLLFGQTLIQVVDYIYKKTHEAFHFEAADLYRVLATMILVKAVASVAVAILAFKISPEKASLYESKMTRSGGSIRSTRHASLVRSAFSDLLNPLFVVSIFVTSAFLFLTQVKASQAFWILVRPIVIAFALFYLVRRISFERLIFRLEKSGFSGFGKALAKAIKLLKDL